MKTNLLGFFIRNKKSNVNYYFVSYVYSKIGEIHFASTNIRVDGVFSLRQVKELIELHLKCSNLAILNYHKIENYEYEE